eukprot:GHRR01027281.1.p2 GENE.GHRR01027281.1~~GHRR01027281.1.p2  ORF type:complete len:128 (+),score=20.59 GHRR01027281.1:732-1115(+)
MATVPASSAVGARADNECCEYWIVWGVNTGLLALQMATLYLPDACLLIAFPLHSQLLWLCPPAKILCQLLCSNLLDKLPGSWQMPSAGIWQVNMCFGDIMGMGLGHVCPYIALFLPLHAAYRRHNTT